MRTFRFLRSWIGGVSRCDEREVELQTGKERRPATVFFPPGAAPGSRPAWIALHGVTRPGRSHAALTRFCRAMAASGAVTVVPEIEEWVQLRLAPRRTVPAVRAAVEWLGENGWVDGGEQPDRRRPGLIGFSFGAPQALRAAADPALRGKIGGVAGFGGYFDVHRIVRFQLTGRHEWNGRTHVLEPDPYGCWIMAANHLTDVPGYEGAGDVARALWRLAAFAGDEQIPSDSPRMGPYRAACRERVSSERANLFDLLAQGPSRNAGGSSDAGRALAKLDVLADGLAAAALQMEPHLDVRSRLQDVECPVELVHGKYDRLIPYTESLRLAEAFGPDARVRITVTDLFAHSRGSALAKGPRTAFAGWRFFSALRRVLGMV